VNELAEKYVALIQENENIIHKVIGMHVIDAEDKKDLFQEVLLQSWKSFPKFEARANFSTWLYRVSLNTVFTFKKRVKKRINLEEVRVDPANTEESKDEPHELLYRIIQNLGEVDCTIMTLHLDGYKNKEIGEIIGLKLNHINVKIHRLKEQIVESYKHALDGRV